MLQTQLKPVTLFTSADTGAPVLSEAAGSLKTLLKACLVSGYGDKTALGWEMQFETAQAAAFRSTAADSNKHFLRVDNTTERYATVHAYTAMSSFDSGTGEFHYNSNYEKFGYVHYSYSENADWWLVGHDKAFVLIVGGSRYSGSYRNNSNILYFGDFPSVVPGDTGNTVYLHSNSTSQYYSTNSLYYMGMGGGNNEAMAAKRWDGSEVKAVLYLNSLCAHDGADAAYPDKLTGGTMAAEIYLYETFSNGGRNLRGLLPGLFKVQNNLQDLPDGTAVPLDGQTDRYLKFCVGSGGKQHILINTTRWESS